MYEISQSRQVLLNLRESPEQPLPAARVQARCRQLLEEGRKGIRVWLFRDAVHHLRHADGEWLALRDAGVRIHACRSACERRLDAAEIRNSPISVSSLLAWADFFSACPPGALNYIVDLPLAETAFMRESLDPLLALLALENRVNVIFTAPEHLLRDSAWQRWRMFPETEPDARMLVGEQGVEPARVEILRRREGVEIRPQAELEAMMRSGINIHV